MAERPIKKSERQAKPDASDGTQDIQPTADTRKSRSTRGADKGKKASREDEPRQAGNLALMRGPKPTKPKPPVAEEVLPEVAEDTSTEATTESPEATTEMSAEG